MGKRTRYVKPNDKGKDWYKKQNGARPERDITIKKTFLIYCEGKNTEPEYFKSFPVTTQTEVKAIGLGRSRTALVEKVIELIAKIEYDKDQEIWVVFDRDVKYDYQEQEDKDFNEAISLANGSGIKCAYSNDCFELWFLLHYDYLESSLHRNDIYEKLSDKLGFNYEKAGKSKDFVKRLYLLFQDRLPYAIRNAKKLHKSHSNKEYHLQNPCTTVYQLVEALNENLRK
jgi:RloB-like protein